jgi:hypothetical protein
MIDGFGLLCGHLVGDYILQNDWQAGNKTNPTGKKAGLAYLACLVHCVLYTFSVWAFNQELSIYSLSLCFGLHYPIDRWRLAVVWMKYVSGQKGFATGSLAPWSFIIVDNVFHLVTLFFLATYVK